jgi:hypothetical protein
MYSGAVPRIPVSGSGVMPVNRKPRPSPVSHTLSAHANESSRAGLTVRRIRRPVPIDNSPIKLQPYFFTHFVSGVIDPSAAGQPGVIGHPITWFGSADPAGSGRVCRGGRCGRLMRVDEGVVTVGDVAVCGSLDRSRPASAP